MRSPLLLLLAACSDYELNPKDDVVEPDDTAPVEVDDTAPPEPTCADWPASAPPTASRDETCLRQPSVGTFNPVVEWNTDVDLGYASSLDYVFPYVMPAVANLTDDDGDGDIDRFDVPDIAWTVFNNTDSVHGALRVVSGDGSREHWVVESVRVGEQTRFISRFGGVAIGDLEGDGRPDIVTLVHGDVTQEAYVVALEADGTPKWLYTGTPTSRYSYPSLADLDQDGDAEVVVGQIILDSDGTELGVGTGGTATPVSHPWPSWGSISVPVDVDGDGLMEIAAGNTLYDLHGNTLATNGLDDGFCAVGDLDGDGEPEIVTTVHRADGRVYVWNPDGSVVWDVPTGAGGGGPPTIADFDGDGQPEVGVAGRYRYTVLDTDGSVLWQADIVDESSSATGSSVFDFDGDGASEVVFADEVALYVFDGATGAVVFQDTGHAHGTAWEYPVIADVDRDGAAEIILGSVSTRGEWNGITVLGDADGSWAPARPIWNQHAYSITNIDSDGRVPRVQQPNWETWNNFRAGGTELGPSHHLPDLAPQAPEVCALTCALDVVTLWLPLANGGLLDTAEVDVALVRADGQEVFRETVAATIAGAGLLLGPLEVSRAQWGEGLGLVVDPEDRVLECDEADNTLELGGWPCP